MAAPASLRVIAFVACLLGTAALQAADGDDKKDAAPAARFFDASDGWFDVSGFLDTAYGFVPIVAPITEPAVGYGAAGALVFIDRNVPGQGQPHARPNIAVAGGLATENGTRGLFAGHLGNWLDGRLRTLVAVADADANLEFFGLGGDRRPGGSGLGYTVSARGGVAGANYRLGDTQLWIGLRYALASTRVSLTALGAGLPGIPDSDRDLKLAGLTPSITLDTRDNFFTPTRGSYLDLSVPVFRAALGGDRDFEKAALTAMHFEPLGRTLFFGVRGPRRPARTARRSICGRSSGCAACRRCNTRATRRRRSRRSCAGSCIRASASSGSAARASHAAAPSSRIGRRPSRPAAAGCATCWRASTACRWASTWGSVRTSRFCTSCSATRGFGRESAAHAAGGTGERQTGGAGAFDAGGTVERRDFRRSSQSSILGAPASSSRQMRYIEYRSIRGALAAVLDALVLAGCASDPRYSQGVDWVTAQEAERKRLEAAGFPQYTGAP